MAKPEKYARIAVDVWKDPANGHIHVASAGSSMVHTYVTNRPESKRYNPSAYRQWERVLEALGKPPSRRSES